MKRDLLRVACCRAEQADRPEWVGRLPPAAVEAPSWEVLFLAPPRGPRPLPLRLDCCGRPSWWSLSSAHAHAHAASDSCQDTCALDLSADPCSSAQMHAASCQDTCAKVLLRVSVLCTHACSLKLMSVQSSPAPPDGLSPLHKIKPPRVSTLLPGCTHIQWPRTPATRCECIPARVSMSICAPAHILHV